MWALVAAGVEAYGHVPMMEDYERAEVRGLGSLRLGMCMCMQWVDHWYTVLSSTNSTQPSSCHILVGPKTIKLSDLALLAGHSLTGVLHAPGAQGPPHPPQVDGTDAGRARRRAQEELRHEVMMRWYAMRDCLALANEAGLRSASASGGRHWSGMAWVSGSRARAA